MKADASFSVSRALQLQLPKQLAVLEEVSEYASREYSLERALDKMQVRCFLACIPTAQLPLGSVSSSSMCLHVPDAHLQESGIHLCKYIGVLLRLLGHDGRQASWGLLHLGREGLHSSLPSRGFSQFD